MSRIRTAPDGRLSEYIASIEPPEHVELRTLRELTQRLPRGFMQIQPEQGHFLSFLVKLLDARRVLEIGTFTGYSAMTIALAMPADGVLVTCDVDKTAVDIGRPCWGRAGIEGKIDVRLGPALDTIKGLERDESEAFDLAFIDADKLPYDAYYEYGLKLVRPGGVIVFDNMFQRGEVADPSNRDPRTMAVRALNAKIAADERVDRVVLPFADGMTLTRRRM